MKLVVATGNQGKLKEIREILPEHEIICLKDLNIDIDIVEDGSTFEENAVIKAQTICKMTNMITIADDSGLVVDYLGGAPGIYSARYAGEDATDDERNNKLLSELKDVPFEKRTARFACAIAIAYPNGETHTFFDTCEGKIAFEPLGKNGFGYDPLFYFDDFKTTLANVDSEIKNKVSHRYKALVKLKNFLDAVRRSENE